MKAILPLAATAIILSLTAKAGVLNGSFELGVDDPGSFTTLDSGDNTSIYGWTVLGDVNVLGGNVDLIGDYWVSADGVRNLDLNGFTPGGVSQTLATVVGATYVVTFNLSGNPDGADFPLGHPYWSPSGKVVLVSDGSGSQTYTFDTIVEGNSHGDMRWQLHSYTFVATGTSTPLSFTSQIPGAFGPAIDNVSVTETLPPPQYGSDCMAAPAVSAHYLNALGIKPKSPLAKNINAQVADKMGPGSDFAGYHSCDPAYVEAVEEFVNSLLP